MAYCQALERRGNQPEWLLQQAIAHLGLDQTAEALATLDQVLGLDSNLPEAYFQRAIAHCQLDNRDAAQADLAKAIQLKPEFEERGKNEPSLKGLL